MQKSSKEVVRARDRGRVANGAKQCLLDSFRTIALIKLQQLCLSAQDQSRQHSSMESEGVHNPSPHRRNYTQLMASEIGRINFFKGVAPSKSTTLQWMAHSQNYMASTISVKRAQWKNICFVNTAFPHIRNHASIVH